MDDLLTKAMPGTQIRDLKVPAERLAKGKLRKSSFSLAKLKGETNLIIFYTEGCEICKAEKSAIAAIAARDRKMTVLMVNVDEIMSSDPQLAEKLFDSFDLSSLPYIVMTDRKGNIVRRYLSYR